MASCRTAAVASSLLLSCRFPGRNLRSLTEPLTDGQRTEHGSEPQPAGHPADREEKADDHRGQEAAEAYFAGLLLQLGNRNSLSQNHYSSSHSGRFIVHCTIRASDSASGTGGCQPRSVIKVTSSP